MRSDKEWALDEWEDYLMGNFENGEAIYNRVVNRVKYWDSRTDTRTKLTKRITRDLRAYFWGTPPEYGEDSPHIMAETRRFRSADWERLAIFCIELALGE